MKNPNRFYTYAYLREDGSPYYVGKGSGKRAYSNHGRNILKPEDESKIIILKKNLDEEDAYQHEVYMIAIFGRKDLGTGILYNKTNGGEGNRGLLMSEETKRKMSEKRKNKPLHKNFIKAAIEYNEKFNRGVPKSEECKRKISESLKGRFIKEDNPFYGKKHTEESINKMKEKLKTIERPETTIYKNSIWITDGIISKRLQNGLEIPEGWVKGRVHKKNIYPKYSR
jgi:hypothetical protein